MTLQIVASCTDDTRSVNYDLNTFIIQATDVVNDGVPKINILSRNLKTAFRSTTSCKFLIVKSVISKTPLYVMSHLLVL